MGSLTNPGRTRILTRIAIGVCLTTGFAIGVVRWQAQSIAQEAMATTPKALEVASPSGKDATIARVVSQLMPRDHISAERLNDKHGQRALELFVKSLDPLKLYFYQSDIDEFNQRELEVDDMIRSGNLSLAYDVFRRFTTRVDERVAVALRLLDGSFDFERDEEIVIEPDAASYPRDKADADDRWRRQVKFALLDLKDNDTEGAEAIDRLRRRYSRYSRRWRDTSTDDLLEMYLTAMTMSYDPHSTYMSAETLTDFTISMRLQLDGIGAALREKDGSTVVSSVIAGGAAAKHGKLKPDDVIVSVGQGSDGEMVDIVEMRLRDVVKQIRGRAGTVVRLGVKPGGSGPVEEYEIVRASIELEESAARGQVIDHVLPGRDQPSKIGYISLPSFYLDMEAARRNDVDYRSSTRDVRRILEDFRLKGIEGVVLDLSRNGGGSLTEAISLTGLFIDRGPVVQVKNSDGTVEQHSDNQGGAVWTGPLVVMTSKFSASASEIFAGAVKDYGRAIVVGDPTTHGKGTVQTLMDLSEQLFGNRRENYGALKVTLQQFYLPDGESTQLEGVAADVVLPSMSSKMPVAEGDLDYALAHDSVKPARHMMYRMVPPTLVRQLQMSSATRVENDEEFVELLRRINLYVDQKEQDTVSLEETAFMERRAALDAQKEEEDEALETEVSDEEVFRDSFYNREVLNIATEYIQGLKQQNLAQAR
ncbi:MAG: carboxy terminal-processing peptidase [Planctomycetota bacterium]